MKSNPVSTFFLFITVFAVTNIFVGIGLEQINMSSYTIILVDFLLSFMFVFLFYRFSVKNKAIMNSFGKLIKLGIIFSLVSAFLLAAYRYIYVVYLNPLALTEAMVKAMEEMKSGGYSEIQIEEGLKVVRMMNNPILIFFLSFFGFLFSTAVSSLICSLIFKQRKHES